jgi:hypothetical protein
VPLAFRCFGVFCCFGALEIATFCPSNANVWQRSGIINGATASIKKSVVFDI